MINLGGLAFWVFVAVVVVAALRYYQARNREKHKTIRLAMEKGIELGPALIKALDKPAPASPDGYFIGGIVCLATGIGLIPFGFFISLVEAEALYPLLGAGVLTILIGVSLILVARWIKRGNEKRGNVDPGM